MWWLFTKKVSNILLNHPCIPIHIPIPIHLVSVVFLFYYIHAAVLILFDSKRQHWVATAYLDGEVYLYDSCFPGRVSPSVEQQLVQLYRPAVRDGMLSVKVIAVQQQDGCTDCGLFSIATSYHAAMGDHLEVITFQQDEMRKH